MKSFKVYKHQNHVCINNNSVSITLTKTTPDSFPLYHYFKRLFAFSKNLFIFLFKFGHDPRELNKQKMLCNSIYKNKNGVYQSFSLYTMVVNWSEFLSEKHKPLDISFFISFPFLKELSHDTSVSLTEFKGQVISKS